MFMADDCIFCKIAAGTVPAFKIYEDGGYVAILDKYPNVRGQAVVISKKHLQSNVFRLPDSEIASIMKATKKVALLLEEKLGADRVNLAFEGHLPHLHSTHFPAYGFTKRLDYSSFKQDFFERYPGYLTTLGGPEASSDELTRVQKMVLGE